jgi:predicted PurR-regulated permease PerM
MLPRPAQEPTHEAFRRGWVSLGHYARTQVLVAGVDAVGIGLGALVLRLPFVLPLTLLVFLSSFVPIVGAVFSGAVAVLIALVTKGPTVALVMLGIVVLVQQVETHVLQPFLMGRAVALHPLAVIAAVAIGSFLLGIVGALFAVPVLAVANTVIRYYVGHGADPDLARPPDTTQEATAADTPGG